MPEAPKPTDAELDILGVLWQRGRATVRDVHDQLAPSRGTGYTTTLKLMQVMLEKGLVARSAAAGRGHVYRAVLQQDPVRRRIVGQMLDRLFAGSTRALVQQALDSGPIDPTELAEIRALIDHHVAQRATSKRKP
jgi:BlaI family transcriptional regulator, penicillinase repressor